MTEAEMNSYRFGRGEDPTDEMLAQIMHEAVADAKRSNAEAVSSHIEEMRKAMKDDQRKWADRINEIKNGNR